MIKAVAAGQTKAGRDPAIHGPLHLFVITNASAAGIGSGTVNTQRMLESLGRGHTMPAITKLRRIEKAKVEAAALESGLGERLEQHALVTLTKLTDALGGTDFSDEAREAQRRKNLDNDLRKGSLQSQIEAIEGETFAQLPELSGLKVHVCSLVAPDSPAGKKWMEVYIHSKLMIVDDVFTTHGSANINTRSMQVDSELNIAHEWASVTQAMRRRLWGMHTNGLGAQDDPKEAFEAWEEIINRNKGLQSRQLTPYAPLVEFYFGESDLSDLD
ncbi:Cardiolipin synthase [compost metagenome]